MTREEAINKAIELEFGEGNSKSIRDHNYSIVKVAEHLYDLLQPSLPSNLDEAAFTYENDLWESGFKDSGYTPQEVSDAFKARAEWMAGQGEIHESEIVFRVTREGLLPAVTCLVDNSYKEGDKVIIQVRKK